MLRLGPGPVGGGRRIVGAGSRREGAVTRIGRLATGTVCLLVLVGCEAAPPPEDALLGSLPRLEPTETLRI